MVWRNELIAVCDALAEVLNISTCPRVGWQECVRLIKERLSKQPAAPGAPAVDEQQYIKYRRKVAIHDEECDVCAVEGDADCYCPVGNGRCANFKPAAPVAPDGKTVVQSPNNGTYFEPLLNCPFCGKKAVINNEDCSVDCSGCTASTFAQDFVEQAVRQWNKRQPAVEGKRNSCDGCEYDNGPHLTPCNSCCDGEIRLNYKPIKPYPSCEKLRGIIKRAKESANRMEAYIDPRYNLDELYIILTEAESVLNQPKGER